MATKLSPAARTACRFGRRLVTGPCLLKALPVVAEPDEAGIRLEMLAPCESLPALAGKPVQDWGEDEAGRGMALHATSAGYLLRFSRLADFELRFDESLVRVRPQHDLEHDTLEHLLVDQVLPRFLAHEGQLLVHASALTIAGRTVLFLGESGWGKSTLAGLLHRAGHALLSDDCVQIALEAGAWRAWPTYPSLRLFEDSLDHAFPGAEGLAAVAGYSRKRRLPVPAPDSSDATPAAISALYLLDEPSDQFDRVRIEPMRPVSACLELMRHAFKLDMNDRRRTQALFAQCSELARAVPAYALDYPRDYARSGELVAAIVAHAAAGAARRGDESDARG